jgi:CRP/FNR family transcriptional regulator, cyclic AMP receptor protein
VVLLVADGSWRPAQRRSAAVRFVGYVSGTVRSMGVGDEQPDLEHVWLFSGCSRVELRKITKVHEKVVVPSDTLLVEQGEAGLLFFVVLVGTASVVRDGRSVSSLGPGDYFGELALLDSGPRSASVTSETEMTLLVIRQRHFQRLLQTSPTLTRRLLGAMVGRLRAVDELAYH